LRWGHRPQSHFFYSENSAGYGRASAAFVAGVAEKKQIGVIREVATPIRKKDRNQRQVNSSFMF